MRTTRLLCTALLLAPCAFSVETKSWTHGTQADFEKGTLKELSLRSDGRLTLAPVFRELYDVATPYLWALAVDSKGTIYTGGGGPSAATSKLIAIDPAGKGRTLAEIPGLQIQAIAIDRNDRVYAATSPDGKVYRVAGNGKPEIFYEPKAKYIWALAFNSRGDLFVATGDQGEIHRVTPDGKGSIFFRTEETHARSMAIDAKDNVIAGTEPGGLVIRISPAGEGFVVYQAAKREVTAMAVNKDGTIYAAATGNKSTGTPPSLSVPMPTPPVPVPSATGAAGAQRAAGIQVSPAPMSPAGPTQPPSIAGGSEVYRIGTDGYPHRVWTHAQDIVYAIAFDAAGRPIVGAGKLKIVVGRATFTSEVTQESGLLTFGVLHFGDHNMHGGVREYRGAAEYERLVHDAMQAFSRADIPAVIRAFDRGFGLDTYSLRSLFRDEQRNILSDILTSTLDEAEAVYRQLYEHHAPLMRFLADLRTPLPKAFRTTAEYALNSHLRRAFSADDLDTGRIRSLLEEARLGGVELDDTTLEFTLRKTIERIAERLRASPSDLGELRALRGAIGMLEWLPFAVTLWAVQNVGYDLLQDPYPAMLAKAKTDDDAEEWVANFRELARRLSVRIDDRER